MSNTKIKSSQFHGVVGHGTDGYFLVTNGDGSMSWISNVVNPVISSLSYPGSATAADPAGGETITITGTGFKTGATVTVGGTAAPSVSYVSATSLTITTPAKAAGDYDVVVTNTDGGTATSVNGISFNGIPSWTTAAGTLGTFASDTTISTITLQATEPDGGTITFSITNGALPTGLSLTGANIDGTTTLETADTLYTFTVTATDDETQTTPRTFTITVTKQFIGTENFTINTYTGNGSTQSIEGKIGTAADFNGSSSYIENTDTSIWGATWTISLWFKTSNNSGRSPLFTFGRGNYTDGIELQAASSNTVAGSYAEGTKYFTKNVSTDLDDGNFHHYCITYDSSTDTIKLYIDGNEETGLTTGTGNSRQGSGYRIGRFFQTPEQWATGSMDQVRIFNKAILSSEVTTLYGENNASSTKSTTDIFDDGSGVALYEFEEGAKDTGTGTIDSGQSAVFNGSSSDIDLPSGINSTTMSVSFWMYANVTSGSQVVFELQGTGGGSANQNGYAIYFHSSGGGKLYMQTTNANASHTSSNSAITASEWIHVVGVWNNGARTFYINNIAQSGGWINTYLTANENTIGSRRTGEYFNGKIDQVRIYSSALSSGDVTNLYNETNVPTANLVAHYKLDGNGNDETTNYNATSVNNITYSDPAEFPPYNGTPTNVSFVGTSFQPDLVWIQNRSSSGGYFNAVMDTVRGANAIISTNSTGVQTTSYTQELTSFNSNGFTLGTGGGNYVNRSGDDYVAWCWKAGGAAASNTDGVTSGSVTAVTSEVSANQDAGFSICEFTTPSSGKPSWGHGLSQAPELIIAKSAENTGSWYIWSPSILGQKELRFTTAAATSYSPDFISADSSKIDLGSSVFNIGVNSRHINYNFHSVTGYQKVGSYTGTSSSVTVTGLGFQPRFLLIKGATAGASFGGSWLIVDDIRGDGGFNVAKFLTPHSSGAEFTNAVYGVTFTSDGFTIPSGSSVNLNTNGGSFIYLAIA